MTIIDKSAAALGAAAARTAMAMRAMRTQVEAEGAVKGVIRDNVKAAARMVEGDTRARDADPRRHIDRTV